MPKSIHNSSTIDWIGDSEWVFTPTQSRSRESLENILISARDLFIQRGYSETTVKDISRKSGVSVGSICYRFADKQAILYTVLEAYRRTRFVQIEEMAQLELFADKSLRDVLEFHLEIIFSATRKDIGIMRLIERQRMVDPMIRDMQVAWDEQVCCLLANLYRPHAHLIATTDIDTTVRYLHHIIRGSVLWSILGLPPSNHFLDIESSIYREHAYKMAMGYLGLRMD